MPIDSSIALSGRPVQFDNPMDVQGKVMSLRALAGQQQLQQMQIQQAQQQQEQERTLADLYKGNVNPDGTINRQGVLRGAADNGLGNRIPTIQKQFLDTDEAQGKVGKLKAETSEIELKVIKQRLDMAGAAISSLLASPNVTHDDVIRTVTGLVQRGVIDQDQGARMVQSLPGDPVRLRERLLQTGLETMDAKSRLDALTPKFDKVNNGKVTSFVDTNAITNPGGPADIRMTTTPGEDQSAATQRRGQNMTDARAREANQLTREANATTYDTERGMLVNRATGLARPVATIDGKPLGTKPKDLTDAQAKALLFGTRMQEADVVLNKLATQGTDRPSLIKSGVERTPLIGGALGAVANSALASPAQQQVEQAQRDFINAVLRRESGAVISDSEFDNARKQYFPQVGDSPAVKQQKQQNRRRARELMLEEVPIARRTGGATPRASTPVNMPAAVDFQLPSDIQAILNKHGGK